MLLLILIGHWLATDSLMKGQCFKLIFKTWTHFYQHTEFSLSVNITYYYIHNAFQFFIQYIQNMFCYKISEEFVFHSEIANYDYFITVRIALWQYMLSIMTLLLKIEQSRLFKWFLFHLNSFLIDSGFEWGVHSENIFINS